jgi:riboflavin kinase/FMN adenylyltransferase
MQIIDPFENSLSLRESVACIGFFDGVHLGHQFLLGELTGEAGRRGMASAVVTFVNHPRSLTDKAACPRLLQQLDDRLAALASLGIDYCFLLRFTPELRELTAEAFIRDVLRGRCRVGALIVGYDHHFGRKSNEGFADYRAYGHACGMEVLAEPPYAPEGMHISSSAVRRALLEGAPERAKRLLGRPFRLNGTVVAGAQIGRTIGYPTANIRPAERDCLVPRHGVYAAWAEVDGVRLPAMVNIGHRPTIDDDDNVTIEAHLIGYEGDLYGRQVALLFEHYLRDERRMESIDDLRLQLDKDRSEALRALGVEDII